MTSPPGLRERKKERTRQALISGALDLFETQGYRQTTVAQIAAAADVSTKTFFSYFHNKADVLFVGAEARVDTALRVIAERGPDDEVVDVLVRAVERMLADDSADDPAARLTRQRLILSEPELQGHALRRLLSKQAQMVDTLLAAYPAQLDAVTAAGTIGSMLGATIATIQACVRAGHSADRMLMAVRRAAENAVRSHARDGAARST
ncbi:hypothetical protein GCM10027451_51320 [Geodermatophilus aquaeductus]|uniref:Transcriptional regulator, TetR family n=1 Tax=Geodermatophilus aquaeductus TaxID=1564161 RepID=A0A521F9U1_9ACTN|nr:TetR/AcrR family transcriptional regulator [Geodermatophilus aquaeductus]SMO92979.1 transcriptional regulator, TetR family [Geodermatophilus aquaeductus]